MPQAHTRGGGWVLFAGALMVLVGAMNALTGFIAIFNPENVASMTQDAAVLTVSNWGWIHMILGILLVLVGLGVLALNPFARGVGIVLVAVNALAHFASVHSHPFWSIIVIAIDVMIMYSLAVYYDPVTEEK